jgi:hypothetical protein
VTRNSAGDRSIEGIEEPSGACFNGAAQPFATALSEETGVPTATPAIGATVLTILWRDGRGPGLTSVRLAL